MKTLKDIAAMDLAALHQWTVVQTDSEQRALGQEELDRRLRQPHDLTTINGLDNESLERIVNSNADLKAKALAVVELTTRYQVAITKESLLGTEPPTDAIPT